MAVCQYTETNLLGYLNVGITAADRTIQVKFYDKVTGVARTPLATTLLFVIDKGSSAQPNSNYEIILAGSHSTASGVTTMINCVRGLAYTGVSLAAGTGKAHVANAEVGCADVHYLWNILVNKLNGTEAIGAALNFDVRPVFSGAGIFGGRVFADATARDAAITAPVNGDFCYNTDLGVAQDYIGGAWVNRAADTTANASETVCGRVELATNAEMRTGTSSGTGGRLVPPNDQLTATSAGAGDQGKIGTLDSAGTYGPFLGMTGCITAYGGSSAPTGWLLCDGSAVSRTTYAALFAIVSTTYGSGDGATTFNVPNLQGKVPVGKDTGTFSTLGASGGEETHTLLTTELASHTHATSFGTTGIGSLYGVITPTLTGTVSITSASSGGGLAHNNLQPYLVINYIIKY